MSVSVRACVRMRYVCGGRWVVGCVGCVTISEVQS